MKRNVTHKKYELYWIKPLFWKRCLDCGSEYKREKMWAIGINTNAWRTKDGSIVSWGHTRSGFKYLCADCYPTEKDVKKRLDDGCVWA